jgi:hypothetical protein
MDMGLADRDGACASPRIPTSRYPLYSTTKSAVYDANGNAVIEFSAERDLLIAELTVEPGTVLPCQIVRVSTSYCNTDYLEGSSHRNWAPCCDRKPFFLVGVRENKTIRFNLAGGTVGATALVTIAGFQGNGCCS